MSSSRPALDVRVEAKKKKNATFLKDCDANHMTIVPQSCDATAGAKLEVMKAGYFLSLTFLFIYSFIYHTIKGKVEGLCYCNGCQELFCFLIKANRCVNMGSRRQGEQDEQVAPSHRE